MVRSPRLLTWGSRRLPCKLDIDVTERNTSCKTDSDELPHSYFRLVLDIISSMKHNRTAETARHTSMHHS